MVCVVLYNSTTIQTAKLVSFLEYPAQLAQQFLSQDYAVMAASGERKKDGSSRPFYDFLNVFYYWSLFCSFILSRALKLSVKLRVNPLPCFSR